MFKCSMYEWAFQNYSLSDFQCSVIYERALCSTIYERPLNKQKIILDKRSNSWTAFEKTDQGKF